MDVRDLWGFESFVGMSPLTIEYPLIINMAHQKNGSSVKWSDVTQMSVKTSFLNSRVHAKHVPGWDVPFF
jgi:hypothetical protein